MGYYFKGGNLFQSLAIPTYMAMASRQSTRMPTTELGTQNLQSVVWSDTCTVSTLLLNKSDTELFSFHTGRTGAEEAKT